MKKRILLCAVCAALITASVFVGGCDLIGGNTGDTNVNVNNTYYTPTDEQWREYIENLTPQSGEQLQAAVNLSLMSGVSILTRFSYTDIGIYGYGAGRYIEQNYHLVYTGSGVIVELDKTTGDAYVLTNCHVVYSDTSDSVVADDVRLYLYGQDTEGVNYTISAKYCTYKGYDVYDSSNNRFVDYDITEDENYKISATVVAASVTYDIALLKVTGSDVLKKSDARVAVFDESDDVYAGQQVYAIGNPEGEGASATVGVISKTSENIDVSLSDNESAYSASEYRVIRTDAAINGGNSGGGLYNTQGKLVGIINAKTVKEEVDNMGYALPASNVKRLWLLMKDKQVEAGISKYQLGVKRGTMPAEYGILSTSSHLSESGAEIVETVAITKAGGDFKVGDVIKHIKVTNGSETVLYGESDVNRLYHLEDVLLTAREGYNVTVTVTREGQAEPLDITFKCSDNMTKVG